MATRRRRHIPRIGGGAKSAASALKPLVPLVPHQFKTEKLLLEQVTEPQILLTPQVHSDCQLLVQLAGSDELSWLGTVQEIGSGNYLIDKFYMIGQEVHFATTEMTTDGLGEFLTALADTDEDACNRMLFWGHVHPGDSTGPSPQDEDQMAMFAHNDYFIRAIFGRNGRVEFAFFDFASNLRWNDVSWQVYHPIDTTRREYWAAEVAAKVKKTYTYVGPVGHVVTSGYNPRGQSAADGTFAGRAYQGGEYQAQIDALNKPGAYAHRPYQGGGQSQAWVLNPDDEDDDLPHLGLVRATATVSTAPVAPAGVTRIIIKDGETDDPPESAAEAADAAVVIPKVIIPGETPPTKPAPRGLIQLLSDAIFPENSPPSEQSAPTKTAGQPPALPEETDEGTGYD